MNFSVLSLPTNLYQSNCYLLVDRPSKTALLIDPSVSLEVLEGVLKEEGLTLSAVLLTHCHIDHLFGLTDIQRKYRLPVYCHPLDQDGLLPGHPKSVCQLFGINFEGVDSSPLSEDQTICLGAFQGRYYHTPGHTEGSVCYQFGSAFFSGDTILSGSIGRCDLPSGNTKQMAESLVFIKQLFESQSPDYLCYPGHGECHTLAQELSINPYLQ